MGRAVRALLLALGSATMWAQDAPLQNGPLPGSVVDRSAQASGVPATGYGMEPGMTAPQITQPVGAEYPKDLPVIVGTVRCTLSMVIDEHGMPLFIRVVHSAGAEFDAAAIYAVRQSKFEAGLREQKAVPIRMMVQVSFTADHATAVPEIVKPIYKESGDSSGSADARGSPDAVVADNPPKLLNHVYPEFSEEARRKKVNGTVVLSMLVTEDGMPTDVRVLRGLGYGLDEKAIEAIRQYKFDPATKDGKPIAQHVTVEISFHLR